MDESKLQERHQHSRLTRRRFSFGLCLGLATTLAGCGGTSDDAPLSSSPADVSPGPATPTPRTPITPPPTTTTTTTTPTVAWEVAPNRALSLAAGGTFDLASTLPAGVPPGGSFDVDPSGAPLPAGITLQPNGLLGVSATATGGTSGVVFRYTPPA